MSAGCVRWMLSLAVKNLHGGPLVHRTPPSRFTLCRERANIVSASWRRSPYTTEAPDTGQTPEPKKKTTQPAARASAAIGNVGRRIPHRKVQVFGEDGDDLGTMHRADVVRVMAEKDLKLVLLHENKDPPVYQLMSGKQIYEEQLKQREKKKAKAAPVQMKELTFSSGIASHDLGTKLRQVESWLEKKHHVRVTVRSGRDEPPGSAVTSLEQMVEQMEAKVGFVSRPQAIREGRAAMCILRPPSAKELVQMNKEAKSQGATSRTSPSKTPSVSSTDASEESIQP